MNLSPTCSVRVLVAVLVALVVVPCLWRGASFGAPEPMPRPDAADKKAARKDQRERAHRLAQLQKQFDEQLKAGLDARQKTMREIAETRLPGAVAFLVQRVLESPKESPAAKEAAVRVIGTTGTREGVVMLLTDGFKLISPDRHSAIGDALRNVIDPDARDWIVKKGWKRISSLPDTAQEVFLRVMDAIDDPRVVKGCEKLLGHPQVSLDSQLRCVDLLREYKHRKALKKITKLARVNNVDLNVAVLFAIREMGASEYSDVILDALDSRHWQVRSVAVDTLRDAKDPQLLPYFVSALDDPNAQVRISAIIALRDIGGDEVMDPLITALQNTEDRVRDDIAEALVRLTAEDFGIDPIAWRSWWKGAKGTVKIAGISREEYDKVKEESDGASTGLYYGLRILSQHIAFVIDVSGSMAERFEYDDDEGGKSEKGGGRTGVTKKKKDKNKKKKTATKIAVARKELSKVVSGLRDGTRFNIVKFSGVYRPWQPKLIEMDEPIRHEALTYVKALRPDGETNVYDTLRFAMQLEGVDTIYFLSDGAPTAGATTNPEEILAKVRKDNAVNKVKIHTIGFHLDPVAEKLMKDLAEQNFGRFVKK